MNVSQSGNRKMSSTFSKTKSKKSIITKKSQVYSLTNYIEEITEIFRKNCEEFQCEKIPLLVPLEENAKFAPPYSSDEEPKIGFFFKKSDKFGFNVEKIWYKNFVIETGVVSALIKCLGDEFKVNLVVLRLENCELTSEHIEILSSFLEYNITIQEVSVNGNPNKDQNHYLLLQNTNILILSLKFCNVNLEGIKKITLVLSTPLDNPLSHLNLSSNSLFDEGTEYIAECLRINRKLTSLNLADNKIRNRGCIQLMEALQKFPLNPEEILIRRKIKFDYYKMMLMIKEQNKPMLHETKSKNTKKGRATSANTVPNIKSWENNLMADQEYHPFIQDSFEENQEIYCKGNMTLISLNLSYNRIAKEGLQAIIRMLNYQRGLYANDKGMSRLLTEGNAFENNYCVNELAELQEFTSTKQKLTKTNNKRSRSAFSFKKTKEKESSASMTS